MEAEDAVATVKAEDDLLPSSIRITTGIGAGQRCWTGR